MRSIAIPFCGVCVATVNAQILPLEGPAIPAITERLSKSDAEWQRQTTQTKPVVAPKLQQSEYEKTALVYMHDAEEFRTHFGYAFPPPVEAYWQKRLDLADRVDRGQVSKETAAKMDQAYWEEMRAALGTQVQEAQSRQAQELARQSQEQALWQAQQQAQQQAQAEAQRRQSAQTFLDLGVMLLTPRPVVQMPNPVSCSTYVNGRYISTRCF